MWKEGIFWVFPISPHHFLPITFWVISCLACPLCIQQGGLLLAQGIRNTARGLDKDMHSTLCLPLWGKHANVNVMDGVRENSDKGYEYFWWRSKIPWPSCSYWCPGAWGTRASVAAGWNYTSLSSPPLLSMFSGVLYPHHMLLLITCMMELASFTKKKTSESGEM